MRKKIAGALAAIDFHYEPLSSLIMIIELSHKRVESIEEIPKLKLESINEAIKLNSYRRLLQEFQYGKDVFQTTTNKMRGEMPSRMEI